MSGLVDAMRKIAEREVKKLFIAELGIVTSVFPHSSNSDFENYECNVKLRDRDIELRKVPVATQHIGLSNIPHVDDLVLITFINGDINSPIIIGRLYNEQDRPPMSKMEEIVYKPPYSNNNNLRRLAIELPGNTFQMQIYDNKLFIKLGNDNATEIALTSDGLSIKTDANLSIQCKGNMNIECMGDISIKANNISIESNMSMTIKSNTTANVESSGPMTIKGAIVKIN